MTETLPKPKIFIEEESFSTGILVVGDDSPLTPILREILTSKGVRVDDPNGFNYIFQLGNLEKLEFFLKKAVTHNAKFILILGENINSRLGQKAEKLAQKFKETQNLQGKVIKLSGFTGQEIEAAEKILKTVFSQASGDLVNLKGPDVLWSESNKLVRPAEKKSFVFWKILAFSICLLLSPLVFIAANIFLGAWSLRQTREALLVSDFVRAKAEAQNSQVRFVSAERGFITLAPILNLFGLGGETKEIENWLEVGQNLGLVSSHLVEVGQDGQKLTSLVLGKGQGSIEEILSRLKDDVNLAQRELALTETKMSGQPPILAENIAQIKALRKGMGKLQGFLPLAPWFLGLDSKRTYLVLFQNNMELRPGGGFIGTLGLLTFVEGQADFKIEDVYTADGQLRGHVEPPSPLKNYLDQIHWYLRDSNWDPDFAVNAQRAAWFYEKEMGTKIDGVFALDLSLAQNILSLTGPIELADYQEKISSDNFFLKAQIYTQEKFFPGSTQKKDFLGSLANSIFTKLTEERDFPWVGLGKAMENAVQEKHFLAYFDNVLAQKLISEQGLGGGVLESPCEDKKICLNDYLLVLDANLGVNKVNYFLKRYTEKTVNFSSDNLNSQVTVNFENTSPIGVSFGGDYKDYLRVLRPLGFFLEKVTVDGQEIPLDKIDQEIVSGKNSVGFLVTVPAGSKKVVKLNYRLPLDSSQKEFVYQLLVQKQAGTDKDPLVLNLTTPSWKILGTNLNTTIQNGSLQYLTDLSVDRIFTIKINRTN